MEIVHHTREKQKKLINLKQTTTTTKNPKTKH